MKKGSKVVSTPHQQHLKELNREAPTGAAGHMQQQRNLHSVNVEMEEIPPTAVLIIEKDERGRGKRKYFQKREVGPKKRPRRKQ